MRMRSWFIIGLILLAGGFFAYSRLPNRLADLDTTPDSSIDTDLDEAVPAQAIAATPAEIKQAPKDLSALGGYNVLIADRGNNRLIEVTPDKQIVWEYDFHLPKLGLGADDAFFADNGQSVIVNLEEYHLLELIDYQTKTVKWTYGTAGVPGHTAGFLNTPDDAYKLPNGDVVVADIKNCRIIEIAPDKHIVRQYGVTRVCDNKPGHLNKPNGDTPLANGHTYISTINDHKLTELDAQWQPVFSMSLPAAYPSDPQPTKAGNILISDYSKPGKVVEVTKQGQIVWQYDGSSTVKLDRPSLAVELPNGNILANDDFNHRVIVIDKATKEIVWQYGVTGKPGSGPGQLSVPDGMDIIKHQQPAAVPGAANSAASIGSVTRHAADFLNQTVTVQGYLLKKENSYAIFSDEASGAIGQYDLPVSGTGIDTVVLGQKYILTGKFVAGGLPGSNGNPNHLELSALPQTLK